jgi:tetratricopeptide (TPR) repeat protein
MSNKTVSARKASLMKLAICASLIALTWLVFGQTLGHEFINFDDNQYIYENAEVIGGLSWHGAAWTFTHSHAKLWHPLTTLSHMADCQFYGLRPGGHHFTNVLLHSLGVVLLFLVLRRMTGTMWQAAFVAALFAVHPLKVESVAWIAERKDVLSGVFFALTLAAYLRYVRRPSIWRYLLVCLVFALGLMSKATLVTVPFVLLLLDYWPLRRSRGSEDRGQKTEVRGRKEHKEHWPKLVAEKIPLIALSVGSSLATLVSQTPTIGSLERFHLVWRINNAFVTYVIYLGQLFWPTRLGVFYPHPEARLVLWEVIAAVALLCVITIGAFLLRRRYPYVIVGWLWYLGMLVPVIGFVQAGLQGRADRFTYLPHIGLYIIVAWLITDLTRGWRNRRILLAVAGSIVIVVAAWAAFIQTTYWKDSITLWTRTLAVTSDNDVAHLCMASALMARGDVEQAVYHSREATRIRVDNAGTYGRVPAVYDKEESERAIAHWEERLREHPEDVPARNNLGVLLFQNGRVIEAIAQWQQSLQIYPDDGNAQNNLAWVLATYPDSILRDPGKAVELAEKAVAHPGGDNPTVVRTLAAAYAEKGRYADAVAAAQRAVQLANNRQDAALARTIESDIRLYEKETPLRVGVSNAGAR